MTDIVRVIHHYYPEWQPPRDKSVWNSTLCPFHGDTYSSAAVNYRLSKFRCFACGVQGDIYNVIQHEEKVGFGEAKRRAAKILAGVCEQVHQQPPRKPSRRLFGDQGTSTSQSRGSEADRPVSSGVRRRTFTWG